MATLTFVSAGSSAIGITSVAPGIPAGRVAGDLLILTMAYKYGGTATPVTPSGWTAPANNQAQGGSGTGVDLGVGAVVVYYRISDGAETTPTVTLTSGNTCVAQIYAYRSDMALPSWVVACVTGSDGTDGTAWSTAAGSDPGVTGVNEIYVVASGLNTNAYSATAHAITQTGVTFGTVTQRGDVTNSNGDDNRLVVSEHVITSGTSGGNPTFTMTLSGTAAGQTHGGSVFIRVRAVTLPGVGDIVLFDSEVSVATDDAPSNVVLTDVEVTAAVFGAPSNVVLTDVEVTAAVFGGPAAVVLTDLEVLVATASYQSLLGATSLDLGMGITAGDGELISEQRVIGASSLDFGTVFGGAGTMVMYITGPDSVLDFGMSPNPSGAVESLIENTETVYRLVLEANPVGEGKIKRAPLWRRVDRVPTPYSVVIRDGVAYRTRVPPSTIDPDNLFLGGHEYTIRDSDPRYPILVAAGVTMEAVG